MTTRTSMTTMTAPPAMARYPAHRASVFICVPPSSLGPRQVALSLIHVSSASTSLANFARRWRIPSSMRPPPADEAGGEPHLGVEGDLGAVVLLSEARGPAVTEPTERGPAGHLVEDRGGGAQHPGRTEE